MQRGRAAETGSGSELRQETAGESLDREEGERQRLPRMDAGEAASAGGCVDRAATAGDATGKKSRPAVLVA